ncbi:MAG: hypothetical protein EBV03_11590, partial [Proteobacteria bacterium]|nr:hypothetical protein [Pseudomonadota bacterium]
FSAAPSPAPKLTELPVPANESVATPQAPAEPVAEQPAALATSLATPEVKAEPIALRELQAAAPEVKPEAPKPAPVAEAAPKPIQSTINSNPSRTEPMSTAEALKPKLYIQPTTSDSEPAGSTFGSDGIECDLRVANKIIDEAIRNEMRLTDIVRRIIELPVSNPESVQIPMNLTDEDYQLLAIRYSIPASDRGAIKRRIVEDLNDFSGKKKA